MGKNAIEIYVRLQLDPKRIGYRYPHQVSSGQLQRAMAMLCQPNIIVFDGPTTTLDVATQIEVLAAIKEMTRQFNTAAIYITHDLATVKSISDEIIVMLEGRIVEQGKKKGISYPQHHEYTEELLPPMPDMNPDWLNHLSWSCRAENCACSPL